MKPTSAPDIRRLTDRQQRAILAEIRNARMQGYDAVQIRFRSETDVKVIAIREGDRATVKP